MILITLSTITENVKGTQIMINAAQSTDSRHFSIFEPCCCFWFLAKKMMADECSPSPIQMEGNKQYRLLKEQEWDGYQKMAEEAKNREEKEAKSKEAQVNRLISSIQANVTCFNISFVSTALSPHLRKSWFHNQGNVCSWNAESGQLLVLESWILGFQIWNTGQEIRNPLTIVLRTKNPEYVNFCKLHSLGVFNYWTSYHHTQNLMIFITRQVF